MLGTTIDLAAGAILFVGSVIILGFMRPGADGKVHRVVAMPIFETVIPLSIVCAFAIGLALLIAGIAPLFG